MVWEGVRMNCTAARDISKRKWARNLSWALDLSDIYPDFSRIFNYLLAKSGDFLYSLQGHYSADSFCTAGGYSQEDTVTIQDPTAVLSKLLHQLRYQKSAQPEHKRYRVRKEPDKNCESGIKKTRPGPGCNQIRICNTDSIYFSMAEKKLLNFH